MALQASRIFPLVCVLSVGIWLVLLSQDTLTQSFSLKFVTGRSRSVRMTIEESTLPPPTTNTTTTTTTTTTTETTRPETPMPVLLMNSFQKLPQWDFEDVYNQDTPPRPTMCPHSVRQRFSKAFLPNIRLFLHKDNMNMSEWNRLSHFNNPFGFMELKYDDVMPVMKMIPKPTEQLLLPKPGGDGCIRCAVVGTSGILYGSKKGAEIDAHDYVFRMNGAVTKGYEEDVGNTTSVYIHTAHSITASVNMFYKHGYQSAPHDEGIKYVMIPEGMRDFLWLNSLLKGERISSDPYKNIWPRTYYSGQYNESRFYVLHQDFLRYVRNRFLTSSYLDTSDWHVVRPSNGAFTLFLALHTCDTVSAYGFLTDDHQKYSNYYFERNAKTSVIFYLNHDYGLEKKVWKDLHDSDIIWLYQRTGSEEPKL
ncbi:alpha-N-acetylgalactosaminide alpha-2,6-sialyltransferase 1-like [Parambassis ranga]|uniref:alpha-N-acetylgalactosaminide alpha-2,6-sialyltransferase n=1 Tax=Parambassis ranga TaxID=210632 RepID=A0A6P7IHU6_9TELE|nr:alpha-N-acetylgalactosaminide alpha-2,6-sialyltransferase 1-like [Parambassis ranga]